MSVTRQSIVDEARTWLGTKFEHQGRLKGQGVDCDNFIAEVALTCGVHLSESWENNYRQHEDGSEMMRLLLANMDFISDIEEALPGDVIALCDERLKEPDKPRHVAILTEIKEGSRYMIHASERGVREHRIDGHFWSRIHSAWRLRDIVD